MPGLQDHPFGGCCPWHNHAYNKGMTNTLTAQSPVEIDTELARLSGELAKANGKVDSIYHEIHRLSGEKAVYKNGRYSWTKTDAFALITLLDRIEAGTVVSYEVDKAKALPVALKAANAEAKAIRAEIAKLDDEFVSRGGWSRFFIVNNNNGHIHSSTSCSTCYVTTQFGWNPELSGKTEADAVAELGEILCTVCFPSAPVAWTNGVSKAQAQAAAERKAKAAKKAERFSEVRTNYNNGFKTLRAAQIWVVAEVANYLFGYSVEEAALQQVTEQLLEAGVTEADLDAKVAAKIKRDRAEIAKLRR